MDAPFATTSTNQQLDADVAIVGSGFGGLTAAQRLAKSGLRVVLVSSTPEHLFQPLLYQVATGVLNSEEIAPDVAGILRRHKNIEVRLGTVTAVDPDAGLLTFRGEGAAQTVRFRYLIAATGATQSYFGRDEFARYSFALKTIDDATRLRAQIRRCFEEAARTDDPDLRRRLLSFVVVGAGPTGVEVAGQIRELATRYYKLDDVSVYLVEGAGAALPVYGGSLSAYAQRALERGGVEVVLNAFVTEMDSEGVTVKIGDGAATRRIAADTIVWSAGVQASAFAGVLAEVTGSATDRAGRLLINPDLTVGGYANVFAIGDMTSLNGYPGQSPVAMQEARHAADIISRKKQPGTPFQYFDKGSMSVINRFSAVVAINERIRFGGFIAWLTWLGVHLFYLVGFRNRFAAIASWLFAFVGSNRPGFDQADRMPAEKQRRRKAS
ncbi:NAD(P)/FAD-dependent oxidoreductase [Williamsia muralis]|uniref:NADH:ubiquinone reductase (non-electrogenic) n=1 Tax=Williamsia marianensis TaxID=85044 RepID=A0ABU4F025_WILMA|nr:NAD(P)/FAD-dependent oxidoreductase [Williamsia muralis]MDV7136227.1 NAD(P)/FAD-dependent oxidoreductase [Williamsia muralis]